VFFFVHVQAKTDKYEKEFKKYNYYSFPNFKQLWDKPKTGGVTLLGQL